MAKVTRETIVLVGGCVNFSRHWDRTPNTHKLKEEKFILPPSFKGFHPWMVGWLQGLHDLVEGHDGGKLLNPWQSKSRAREGRSQGQEYMYPSGSRPVTLLF